MKSVFFSLWENIPVLAAVDVVCCIVGLTAYFIYKPPAELNSINLFLLLIFMDVIGAIIKRLLMFCWRKRICFESLFKLSGVLAIYDSGWNSINWTFSAQLIRNPTVDSSHDSLFWTQFFFQKRDLFNDRPVKMNYQWIIPKNLNARFYVCLNKANFFSFSLNVLLYSLHF